MDWEFAVIKSNDVNAFVVPGGKVVVYTVRCFALRPSLFGFRSKTLTISLPPSPRPSGAARPGFVRGRAGGGAGTRGGTYFGEARRGADDAGVRGGAYSHDRLPGLWDSAVFGATSRVVLPAEFEGGRDRGRHHRRAAGGQGVLRSDGGGQGVPEAGRGGEAGRDGTGSRVFADAPV